MNRTVLRHLAAALASLAALPVVGRVQEPAPAPGRTQHPAQHTVAARDVVFKEIPSPEPDALPATDLEGMRKRVGKEITLAGKVADTFSPAGNGIFLLNLARNFRDAASVGVKAARYKAFPDLRALKGRTIVVTGVVETYRDRIQIVVDSPSQIRVVKTP